VQYVICYDIADDRRRGRVAKALLDYGPRAQESVFVANLDEELAAKMWERLERLVDQNWDRVHVFEICEACIKKTRVLGTAEVVEEREFYVI
jgi:CRISPR-associated protein Cas2